VDANDEREPQGCSGDPDDNSGEDQHVGQGVRIHAEAVGDDWRGPLTDFADGNVENEHRGLEDVEPNYLFDEIGAYDDHVQPGHHQKKYDPVIV